MLNTITVMGRLTADPELRETQSGKKVTSITLACERDYKTKNDDKVTDFIEVIAWERTAEFICSYFKKGKMAIATGSLESSKWEDKDGNKRTSWSINARSIYFGESKSSDSSGSSSTPKADEGFMDIPDGVEDEGLPFN